jgi:hypothetical protein
LVIQLVDGWHELHWATVLGLEAKHEQQIGYGR